MSLHIVFDELPALAAIYFQKSSKAFKVLEAPG